MTSLLEEAKKITGNVKRYKYTYEDIELAVGFLKGEITITALAKVKGFYSRKSYSTLIYSYVITAMKKGIGEGSIKIKIKER